MKKEYIIGAVVLLVGGVGGYFWWKSRNSSTEEDVMGESGLPPAHPSEGRVVAAGNAEGKYAGGGVFLVKNGKKYLMLSPLFDQYVKNNGGYDNMKIITQERLDAIPMDGNLFSPETTIGSAKVKGLYDGRDIYLGDVNTWLYTSGAVFHIQGDKKYAWTSPDWTAANQSKQMPVTQDVIDMFTDGGTYTTANKSAFTGQLWHNRQVL